MSTHNCEECIFFKDETELGFGSCRRFPPKLIAKDDDPQVTLTRFPEVTIDMWCGEFKPV